MTPDIERAAEALYENEIKNIDMLHWLALPTYVKDKYYCGVIAVLEALAEPSEAAVRAGARAYCRTQPEGTVVLHSNMRAVLRAANLAVLGRTK